MYGPSITIDQAIDALVLVLQPFIPDGAAIVRAQTNLVPMPDSPFALLTEVGQYELGRPEIDYDTDAETASILTPTRIDIQIDFYGQAAGDYVRAFAGMFGSPLAYERFPADLKPLYLSPPHQGPLITGEQQYESRWTTTVTLQYNPVVVLPQQFADTLSVTLKPPVDRSIS